MYCFKIPHNAELSLIFLLGCFVYSAMEILVRGYTHWTMLLAGGIVGILLYLVHIAAPPHTLLLQAATGAVMITALEMAVGVVDNLCMHWAVWDYSSLPLNVYGQICLPFSLLWFCVSFPAIGVCELVRRQLTAAGKCDSIVP